MWKICSSVAGEVEHKRWVDSGNTGSGGWGEKKEKKKVDVELWFVLAWL